MPSTTEDATIALLKARLPREVQRTVGIFRGPIREETADPRTPGAVGDRAIFVMARGDRDDIPFIDGGAGGAEERPGLTVWVRGGVRDYDDGCDLADAVWRALDKHPPAGFFEARCSQSAPMYLDTDAAQRHRWSINVALKRYKSAAP